MGLFQIAGLLALAMFPKAAVAEQSGQYGCFSNGTHYEMQLKVYPNDATIKYVYGGASAGAGCDGVLVDGIFQLNVPIEKPSPTAMQQTCGVTNVDNMYTLTVVTQSLDQVFKATDRKYTLNCLFNGPVELENVQSELTVANIGLSGIANGPLSLLQSEVRVELIDASTAMALSDVPFMHRVRLRAQMVRNYGNAASMRVKNCVALRGVGDPAVTVIGGDGCADPNSGILPNGTGFSSNTVGSMVTVTEPFQMFMLTGGSTGVIFSCTVMLCPALMDCQNSCSPGVFWRRKREEPEEAVSGEVIAIVKVHLPDKDGKYTMDNGSELNLGHDKESCSNWAYLVAIGVLAVVLLVSLGFAMLLFSHRSRDSRVTAYNGNPAKIPVA